jgi:hypothetical protein
MRPSASEVKFGGALVGPLVSWQLDGPHSMEGPKSDRLWSPSGPGPSSFQVRFFRRVMCWDT